jgi:hypothetical protein
VRIRSMMLAGLLMVSGCDRETLYGGSDFTQDVHHAFADCRDAEIKRLAMAHNIQTAFGRCGSNRFSHFVWSPDGVHLYFQLTHGAHILNGTEKTITTVPTEGPTARAAWLSRDILAIPLPAAEDTTEERIVIYNRTAATMETRLLPVTAPKDLISMKDGAAVLFTALDSEEVRRPYIIELNTGETTRAFSWITQPVTRIAVSEAADLLAWSTATDTELVRMSTGESLHLFSGVTRAVPHDDGRWLALETEGAEISHFDQRTWNEISPDARKRELARQKKWAARQPEWVEMTTQPPEIQLFDLGNGKRYRVTAFWGNEVQWYPAKGNWLAFMMWGIEGKQLNRNVALTVMAERFRMIDAGQMPLGIELIGPTPTSDSPTAP